MNRRQFILSSARIISSVALSGISACQQKENKKNPFTGSIVGPSYDLGHRLLNKDFPAASRERKIPVVIVGGGMAGLSAGWKLARAGFQEFDLFELEPEVGGVARSGENEISPYPWGAHYVPLPTKESKAVRELFEDLGVIEGYSAGAQPVYEEKYLCHSPQERLYIHGKWQEGVPPYLGATRKDLDQLQRFKDIVLNFRKRRGKDGRKALAIPMEFSSRDADLLALDQISMREFLRQNGLDSVPLHWYVNYACRDDYGCHYSEVSAWAGLHYFGSRDGDKDFEESAVLTWPEGNGWIVKQLRKKLLPQTATDSIVFRIQITGKEALIDVYNSHENITTRIRAQDVIFACPRIFAPYIIIGSGQATSRDLKEFQYSPWLVGNLSLKSSPLTRAGAPLAWDNVIYDSPSLGYVVATHQSLASYIKETLITYYYAMVDGPPIRERTRLLQTSWKDWVEFILSDLAKPHPEIRNLVTRIDLFRWGHAMVQPRVGFIWGEARRRAAQPQGNIYFAHSDLSGFSIFEEAQYRGVLAAEKILWKYRIPFASSL